MSTKTCFMTQSDNKNLELEELVKRIRMLNCEPWIRENVVKFVQLISYSEDEEIGGEAGENINGGVDQRQRPLEIPPYDRILLNWLIKAEWDPNNPKTGGLNLVKNAIKKDDIYYFNMLLEFGFYLKSYEILQFTCEHNSIIIFDRLQRLNLNINKKNERGCTPLFSACLVGNFYMAETLLNQGAFINVWHAEGTPLHAACTKGNIYIVGLLIKRGALIEIRNGFGETPLHLACKMGKIAIVRLLLYLNAAVNVCNIAAHTPLHLALYNDQIEIAKLLIEKKANVNSNVSSPLFISCLKRHSIKLLIKLIETGANVNDKNVKNMTPLHAAVLKNYPEAVDLLLAHGAECDSHDLYARTPINYATKLRLTEIIKMLMKASSKKKSKSHLSNESCSSTSSNMSISSSLKSSKSYEYTDEAKQNIEIIENYINYM